MRACPRPVDAPQDLARLVGPGVVTVVGDVSTRADGVNSTFTSAFGGTSSSTKLKASFGGVLRLGVNVPLSDKMVLQLAAARYLIKTKAEVTTETPGVGPITRSLTLRSDPNVFAAMLGYRF